MRSWRLSFEFFPPKTPEGVQKLAQQAHQLLALHPDFFSVTFGAGGSTKEGTLATVTQLQQKTGLSIAPHLSCLGLEKTELESMLAQYRQLNLNRLVALRGDYLGEQKTASELNSASELIQLIRQQHGEHFHVETAAYPECHPKSLSMQAEIDNLKQKVDAGANSAITQYFFNADAYYYYVEECAKQHVVIPIIPGMMPITQFDRLVRFSATCGAEIPKWLYHKLSHYQADVASIKAFGIEFITRLCENLLSFGAPGLHFYTLNQAESALGVITQLPRTVPTPPVLGQKI